MREGGAAPLSAGFHARGFCWLLLLWVGCAHGDLGGVGPLAIESAYLAARSPEARCAVDQPSCCADLAAKARAAASAGETARAAQLWQSLGLACPGRRDEVAAAVLAAARVGPGPVGSDRHLVNVTYRTRLSPAIRLFWLASSVGPRLLPAAEPAQPTHRIEVEVHAIRFADGQPGPLVRASRQLELPLDKKSVVIVEIVQASDASAGAGLEIRAQVDKVPEPPSGAPAAPRSDRKISAPELEKARPVYVPPLRIPLELGARAAEAHPVLRACLDRQGDFDTVRFLEPTHPRLAASLVDRLRDTEHEPYRVGDVAVPSCATKRPG